MAKTNSWSMDAEEMRRIFTLTYDDLHFLEPLRADAQRLYRALVLVWARVERVLVSDPNDFPEDVIQHVSKQLSLKAGVLAQLRNHPSARSATFEAVRKHLEVRAWQESDAEALSAYLIEKVAHTGNPAALFDAAADWMVRVGALRPQGPRGAQRGREPESRAIMQKSRIVPGWVARNLQEKETWNAERVNEIKTETKGEKRNHEALIARRHRGLSAQPAETDPSLY